VNGAKQRRTPDYVSRYRSLVVAPPQHNARSASRRVRDGELRARIRRGALAGEIRLPSLPEAASSARPKRRIPKEGELEPRSRARGCGRHSGGRLDTAMLSRPDRFAARPNFFGGATRVWVEP